MASWRIRFHDKWPHLASLYASTHNLDEEGKYPDPMMGQDNVFDPSEPYGAYRYYVQPSTRSEFSIEEPGYMSRPVYKDEESRSSDYTSGDSFRRGSTCRVLLCVSLVVSFIGVVVAAITLAVLLSQSPTPLPEKPGQIDEFESQASIFNREFNDNLLDNTTDEFKNLEKEFCKAIEQMFTDADSPVKNAFGGCEVLEFINGSVQVKYRLKLFSDTFGRFKMDKKITKKLEDHFAKKVNEIGPWQNLKFNPKFVKKFIRIEPPTTTVPPTTKITQPPLTTKTTQPSTTTKATQPALTTKTTQPPSTTKATQPALTTKTTQPPTTTAATQPPLTTKTTKPPTSTVEATTRSTKSEDKTTTTSLSTAKQTTEHLALETKATHTDALDTITTMKTTEKDTTTSESIATMLAEQTTSSIETIEVSSITPRIVTENKSTIEIITKTSESIETTSYGKVTDMNIHTLQPETKETTSSTISDEIITPTAGVKNVTHVIDNATRTTEQPEVTTSIFDLFFNLNDTFETTEAGTTEATVQLTTVLEITDKPTTLEKLSTPRDDVKVSSTISHVTDSISREASTQTVTEEPLLETTSIKESPLATHTDNVTSIEVTSSRSTQAMSEKVTQDVSVTDKSEETTTKIEPTVDETTPPLIGDESVRTTKAVVNVTESSIDRLSTKTPQEIDISTTQVSVVDEGVSTTATEKIFEGTTKTDITAGYTNATLTTSITTTKETELTTSSAIIKETKEPTDKTKRADATSTVKSIETEILVTQQPSEAIKVSVNETSELLVTEIAPVLNVSLLSDKLTTKTMLPESEPSSTVSTISNDTVKTIIKSVTESVSTPTTDKEEIKTTDEMVPADSTTTLPTTIKKATTITTIVDTTQSGETTITSTKSPNVSTEALIEEVKKVTEKMIGVSEIVLLGTTDAYNTNTSDIYLDFETTTSGDILNETSTEFHTDSISTQEPEAIVTQRTGTHAQTEQSMQVTTAQSIITESPVLIDATDATKPKSEITSVSSLVQTGTTGIIVTEQPATEMTQNDTSNASAVELTTKKESSSSFFSNHTTSTQKEIAVTTVTHSSRPTDEINVTSNAADISVQQTTAEIMKDQTVVSTSESLVTVESSPEITETLKAVTSQVPRGNDTTTQGVTPEILQTEGLSTSKASSFVTETLPDTTGTLTVTGHATEVIPELTSIEIATEKTPITASVTESNQNKTLAESPSAGPSTKETTPLSTSKTAQETTMSEILPDVTEGTKIVETHTDSVTQTVNITQNIPTATKEAINESAANITEQESTTTSSSVLVTTAFDIVSEMFTTETPVNATEMIYTESALTVDIQASTTAGKVTEVEFQTTTTPKPAEEAFLDEYGEAAFNESYVPTSLNKTEETSVISTSNNTKLSKTTLTVPIATTLSTVERGNASDIGSLNISDTVKNELEKSTTYEPDVTTALPTFTKPTSGMIESTTLIPLTNGSTKLMQSSASPVVENGTDAESKAANMTETTTVQPQTVDRLKKDTVSMGSTTTQSAEIKITIGTVKPENKSLLFNDTIELLPKNETSVQLNVTVALNTTSASDIKTSSPVESTTVPVYSTSEYYDLYNDTDFYYVTTETPNVTSDTPGITIDTPVANVTVFSASNATKIVHTVGVTKGTNDTVTVSNQTVPYTTQSSSITVESQTVTETISLLPEDVTEFSTSATSSVP